MATYYTFLWIVASLNVVWFVLQVWQPEDKAKVIWNALSLVVNFGMVMLEVSVVVFLSQGYLVSGWNALVRTLLSAGVVATLDTSAEGIYLFHLGIPLFLAEEDVGDWHKWNFWMIRGLLFVAVYLFILILPYTKFRDRLPARPSFYRYVFILFVFHVLSSFSSALIGFGADLGYCLHGLTLFSYCAFYPPLLYATFLADFFLEEDLQLEDVYYSEMKDAGYFDPWN